MEEYSGQNSSLKNNGILTIVLKEYLPATFDTHQISEVAGEMLWHKYGNQIDVDFPSPKTGGRWILKSKGWVGHIPINSDLNITLSPKIPLSNLFRMLEYAYRLESFKFLHGLVQSDSIQDFYERLAKILALKILDRGRKGLYRVYKPIKETSTYIRGKLDTVRMIKKPWAVEKNCHYEDHTADIDDNQILGWTLFKVARSGMCSERVLPSVRKAYRIIQGFTTLTPHLPSSCIKRLYNRLNNDYEPMHSLCRFFLEQTGPTHEIGEKSVMPFIVDMSRLFELFVAEWLKKNLPENLSLKAQERVDIGKDRIAHFNIDLVIYESETNVPKYVLDTKYKAPRAPNPNDIAQIVAYSEIKDCKEAILIYPQALEKPFDEWIGDNRVRSMAFNLDGDLDVAGVHLLNELLK